MKPFFLLIICCITKSVYSTLSTKGDVIFIPKDYYKSQPPPSATTSVSLSFDVSEILDIDDYKQMITLKIKVGIRWTDSRLRFNVSSQGRIKVDTDEFRSLIWFPQLVVYNLDMFEPMFGAFYKDEMLMILNNEELCHEARIYTRISCPMNFDKFPFDSQECYFQIGSKIPNTHISFNLEYLNGFKNGSTFSEYSMKLSPLPKLKKQMTEINSSFQFHDVTGFILLLSRNPKSYVINYFFPSGLFVVVSWISLVIPPDSIPARIALIFTTFIVLVNISITISATSPLSSKMNSIQVWILVCLVFVAATVIEYSIILIFQRVVKKEELDTKLKILKSNVCMMKSRNALVGATENALNIILTYADFIGFIILLVAFLLFNAFYWSMSVS
ncbi:pH-sensitive chloride channel 2 [Lepeophtheirus salmonis]|uniref:pH-sensitive chloride channel 2 n=1 Tax=Lepeophtheirus salmonis TaxID=72036 RepID=UPI001AE69B60|nr:pH-sensitive chloride channel 2-like [Lepeophtheirus salmonis]